MDNAATTALNKEVLDAMMPYLTDIYGNPSSLHTFGQEAHKAVADAREKVARALNAADAEKEIIFTGCGTESDNMVLRGIAERLSKKGKHIITTAVEHHAVLYTCRYLEKQGFEVTTFPLTNSAESRPSRFARPFVPTRFLFQSCSATTKSAR